MFSQSMQRTVLQKPYIQEGCRRRMNMVTTMKTTMLIMMGWPDAIPAPVQGSLIANKHMHYTVITALHQCKAR